MGTKHVKTSVIELLLVGLALCFFAGSDWTHFRGSDNNSIADENDLPLTVDEAKNVAWKVPLPGRGPSSPIVVGGHVVVTASSGIRQDRLHVLCFDAESGKLQWQRQLWATGHTEGSTFGANAAPTPASDGRLVVAFYSSNDLACFDLQGNLKWFRGLAYDYPNTRNDVGMASSPLLLGQTVIVQLQTPAESFAAGIDTESGQTRWRIERERGAMWASPTVLRGKTREEDIVLMHSRSRLTAHDPQTGKVLWEYEAPCHPVASVTTCGDCVYLPSYGLHALRYDRAKGSVELLWRQQRFNPENASPIVHDGRAYTMKAPAILVCGDASDGKVLWQLRLKGPQWGTPVLAGKHLYCVNHNGLVQVVEVGQQGKLVATSQIDPAILASPAVADGAIYLRSDAHLWKVVSR